jgi:hypothetical protein
MKRITSIILSLAMLNVSLPSCKKEANSSSSNVLLTNVSFGNENASYSSSRILTDSGAVLASNLHNYYCDSAVNDISIPSSNYQSELNSHFKTYYINNSAMHITKQEYETLLNYLDQNPYQHNHIAIESEVYNKVEFYALIDNLQDFVLNKMNDYTDLINYINKAKSDAYSSFTGTDLDAAIAILEGTKKSAYFWLPINLGGSGIGYTYMIDYVNEHGAPQMALYDIAKRTLLVDGVSTGLTFLFIGFLLIDAPVTLVGLAAVVGIPAARASIGTLFVLLAS